MSEDFNQREMKYQIDSEQYEQYDRTLTDVVIDTNPVKAIAGDLKDMVMVMFSLNKNMGLAKDKVSDIQGKIDTIETIIEEATPQNRTIGKRLDKLR